MINCDINREYKDIIWLRLIPFSSRYLIVNLGLSVLDNLPKEKISIDFVFLLYYKRFVNQFKN